VARRHRRRRGGPPLALRARGGQACRMTPTYRVAR
jgi:hypothetical protein